MRYEKIILKKTKKIAFISDAIYPYNKGGKETRIFEISTRLAKMGYDVHIFCMKWWSGKVKVKNENGVTLHALCNYYPLYSGKRRSIRQAIMFSLSTFKLIKEDFDVIDVDHMPHLVLFPVKLVCIIKRKKLFATWNEVWGRKYWVKYMGFFGNIAFLIEWLSARIPDKIIAVSTHTKTKLQRDLKINRDIIVVSNGIDVNEIVNTKPSENKSDIIYAGRLLSHKNIDCLIKSIKLLNNKYPNIKCIIVGRGPEEKKLKNLANKMNLQKNIIFYDFKDNHKDLYALMKSSKVFAFPSTREGFGIAALEANASGIPVITTDHKDNAAKDLIIKGKNGNIVKLDENEIAKNVINFLTMKKNENNYLALVKNYDWKNITNTLKEVYLL